MHIKAEIALRILHVLVVGHALVDVNNLTSLSVLDIELRYWRGFWL
jgi:hypothetical protein